MRKTIAQCWQELRAGRKVLHERQQGQALIIIVFSFIGILAFIGLGVDLGSVYTERVRVARAADAAALAAASELPLEGAAHMRALSYLQENGYDHTITGTVRTLINGTAVGDGASEEDATITIWVDTSYAQDDYQANTADRIKVRVEREVNMMFMQFIGFTHFPVDAVAEAENITNVDTVIVYDKSGSMEFDTLCYGCWEPVDGQMYPDGNIFPLHWSDTTTMTADHCASNCEDTDYTLYTTTPTTYYVNDCNYSDDDDGGSDDRYWIVIEAEEYSRISVDYHRGGYDPYKSYWVMQRNKDNVYHGQDVDAVGRDARGAYLSHHPYWVGTGYLGVNCRSSDVVNGYCNSSVDGGPFPVPQADYDFKAPINDAYYFWIRGQGGRSDSSNHIFWGLEDHSTAEVEDGFPIGADYDGARERRWVWDDPEHTVGHWEYLWDWRCLGSEWLLKGDHTLKLWAGGAGFDVDRIVITTEGPCDDDLITPPGSPDGYPANNGRTDWACSSCDPRFAGRPGGQIGVPVPPPYYRPDCAVDLQTDDLYDDEQPIRGALEAAKNFVARLDPRFDQVGYVRYSSSVQIANELECLRRRGSESLGAPGCDPDGCNPELDPPCDEECGCFAGVITDTVLYELDQTRASGSTNIAGGMMNGIDVLSTDECDPYDMSTHCGRPGAAHIMVLMTDGEANSTSGCDAECDDDPALWPDGGAAKDCVIYYAQEARNNGIVIYTISLGWGADMPLMQEVADITGGIHQWAPSSDDLDGIFDKLFERIFLRLIH